MSTEEKMAIFFKESMKIDDKKSGESRDLEE